MAFSRSYHSNAAPKLNLVVRKACFSEQLMDEQGKIQVTANGDLALTAET